MSDEQLKADVDRIGMIVSEFSCAPVNKSWQRIRARLEAFSDADKLAQIIRQVDGSHSLGAGQLAETIIAAIKGETK